MRSQREEWAGERSKRFQHIVRLLDAIIIVCSGLFLYLLGYAIGAYLVP
jgi:hypothetical protein